MLINLVNKSISKAPAWFIRRLVSIMRNNDTALGYNIRSACYRRLCKKFGVNVTIAPGVYILNPEHISIGNNVSIKHFCIISGYGGIEIGNDVSIAAFTSIFTTTHPYNDPNINIRNTTLKLSSVKIGNNIWIGAATTILYGTTISDGIVIGAQSLVTKNLDQQDSIYIGSPAKLLKSRFN